MDLQGSMDVLEMGSGHGFLTYELASRTKCKITALDVLASDQLQDSVRGARAARVNERISWIVGDGRTCPFRDGSFSAVVSFLALEDIHLLGGDEALRMVVQESCRVLKNGGTLLFADNMFPECASTEAQKLYWTIQSNEFHVGLPSKNVVLNLLREKGMTDLLEEEYDPKITLDEKEAKVELLDVADAKPFGKVIDFGSIWKRYHRQINQTGLAYPRVLSIMARK
jgi:SAM-dependent methyltransferase